MDLVKFPSVQSESSSDSDAVAIPQDIENIREDVDDDVEFLRRDIEGRLEQVLGEAVGKGFPEVAEDGLSDVSSEEVLLRDRVVSWSPSKEGPGDSL